MADKTIEVNKPQLITHNIIAQYQTERIRTLWAAYKRIFQLTTNAIITLDPSNFNVTNTFNYTNITKIYPEATENQFSIECDKTIYTYKTPYRGHLLCQLFQCIAQRIPEKFRSLGNYNAQRMRKNDCRKDCKLTVASYGIVEKDVRTDIILQEYHYINITKIGTDNNARALFFEYSGRVKVFYLPEADKISSDVKLQLKSLGISTQPFKECNVNEIIALRKKNYSSTGSAVAVFDVNKITRRAPRPLPRQMHITEDYVVEKDASGFQYASYQKITAIYAIVRSWNNPREFTIEYQDGSSRMYTSANRDTLLATLLDLCHAVGNVKVIVTGELSDNLRLIPRFAEENYESSIKDAFFGASSIEAWYLTRLVKVCKAVPVDVNAIEEACREMNANVPCPGITANSDSAQVKLCLTEILKNLNVLVTAALTDDLNDRSRTITIMLQTLYRIIPCVHGYKHFVDIKEVDTRQLLLQLMRVDNDFVNYWALEVLRTLCCCSFSQRMHNKNLLINKLC